MTSSEALGGLKQNIPSELPLSLPIPNLLRYLGLNRLRHLGDRLHLLNQLAEIFVRGVVLSLLLEICPDPRAAECPPKRHEKPHYNALQRHQSLHRVSHISLR